MFAVFLVLRGAVAESQARKKQKKIREFSKNRRAGSVRTMLNFIQGGIPFSDNNSKVDKKSSNSPGNALEEPDQLDWIAEFSEGIGSEPIEFTIEVSENSVAEVKTCLTWFVALVHNWSCTVLYYHSFRMESTTSKPKP